MMRQGCRTITDTGDVQASKKDKTSLAKPTIRRVRNINKGGRTEKGGTERGREGGR